jgi:hypothetical protein
VLPTHPDPSALGPCPALSGSGFNQFALKFRQTTENGEHQPTGRSGSVGPLLSEGLKRCFVVRDGLQDHQEVDG